MDDVPGMKAVLSLLIFPNYKPFGTGRGKARTGGWRAVMGPDPSPGRRAGRGGETVGMAKSSISTETPGPVQGRDAQPWTSHTGQSSNALATPHQPNGASLLSL